MRYILPALAALVLTASPALAGPKVGVVIDLNPQKLERFAADELAAQFKQLFDAEVTVSDKVPAGVDHLVLVGSPKTNETVARAVGDRWPMLTDQGHVLRSMTLGDRKALVVGGGSPVATLWAAYELGHRFGIRSFLHGDVMPEKVPELKLDGINVTLEPAAKVRAWQVLGDSPTGFGGWGTADHKQLLRQLAKLKFNRVVLRMEPDQPFIGFQFDAAGEKPVAQMFGGRRFPVAGDTPGRKAFKGMKEYVNPDLAGQEDFRDLTTAGIWLARGIINSAHQLGMSVGLSFDPLAFPTGVAVPKEGDALKQLIRRQVRAYLDTFPFFDALHPTFAAKADPAARALAFELFRDEKAVYRRDIGPAEVVVADPEKGFPEVTTLTLRGFLPRVPAELPPGKDGFLVVAEVPGDLSPTLYFLARRAFDPKLTAKDAHAQLFTPILGAPAAERVALGFALIDEAAALVEKNDPRFVELSPDLMLRHTRAADAPPEWWKKAGKLYAGGMDEMYRGIRATFNDPARPLLLYYAKRCEFAVHYFAALDAARLAGVAKAMGEKGEKDAVVMHLEKAVESTYNALNALGDVARDPSDRGAIAVLAEYAYRPLKAELKAAEKK